ncbi:MAG: arylsulfatase [Candidatus Sumerlaeota bacterium]|nr:arylsulfatase [Candidatus Sumerlaeota bacterium]
MITRIKRVFLLLAAQLLLVSGVPDCVLAADRPNVIVLLTDDQGYGDLACHGNPVIKTPQMDRLYNESVRFGNFHVDSYCTPSRSALMTGRYAHRVGGWGTISGRNMLRDGEVTMADVFRHNGYRTGHFGKWHLGTNYPYRPIDRGFDEWLGHGDGGTGCTTDYWGNDRVNDHYIHNGVWEAKPCTGYETDVFFDAALQFIRSEKSRPFFVYLAPYNPHSPCSVPDQEWVASYRGKGPAYFYAAIARVDENLGRLRAFLKAEGLDGNTLLIFITDNGTAEGEKVFNAGMRGKKGSPYDGGHRVPCFFHWPAGRLDKPVTVDRLAAHLDILPTLVDLCSLKLPKPIVFDGASLKPLLSNPQAPWPERTIVLGTPENHVGPNPPSPTFGQNCSVMADRWRLVEQKELHDMTADPGQRRNVAGEHPDVVNKLRNDYQQYWNSVSAMDKGWRGRPIIGSPNAVETELCAEDWYPTKGSCPWNQAAVANGAASFGLWTVRFAEAGAYRVELRRWPRDADAPMAGVPDDTKTVDAWLKDQPVRGLLYGGAPKALPVARARLKIGASVQEADVDSRDKAKVFTVKVDAGPADLETTLLDKDGKALCSAYYVSIRMN